MAALKLYIHRALWESGTEWYEFAMGLVLVFYAGWIVVYDMTIFLPFTLMLKVAPATAWVVWFASIGVLTLTGVTVRSNPLRRYSAWATLATWSFLCAQYAVIDITRLAFPTFAALIVTNTWLVVRTAIEAKVNKGNGKWGSLRK